MDALKIMRYVVSGGTGAVVNVGVLWVLTHFFGVWYLASSIVAFVAAFAVSFSLQRRWTFGIQGQQQLLKHTSSYFAVSLWNLLFNTFLLYCFVEFGHVWYVLGQVLAGIVVAALSYFLYNWFVFNTA